MELVKYSASGNDFIIFHTFKKKDRSNLAKELCERHEGLGADGLIVLLPHSELDFMWQFYNADGSEAAMCGNGSRAAAHYAFSHGLASSKMRFLTGAGVIEAEVDGDIVETQLTEPKILRKDIIEANRSWWLIDTGVPHLVTFVEEWEEFDKDLAANLRKKYNANVNFGIILNSNLRVRTFERGVEDETLACGTGMAATFLRGLEEKRVKKEVEVIPKSEEKLHLRFENGRLFFKGAVKRVFVSCKEGIV